MKAFCKNCKHLEEDVHTIEKIIFYNCKHPENNKMKSYETWYTSYELENKWIPRIKNKYNDCEHYEEKEELK